MSTAIHQSRHKTSRHSANHNRQAIVFAVVFGLLGIAAIIGILFLANRPVMEH